MSKTGSWANSYKLQSFLHFFHRYRSHNSPAYSHRFDPAKLGHGYSTHQGLQLVSCNGVIRKSQNTIIVKDDMDKVKKPPAMPSLPPPPPPPRRFNFYHWARWLLGSILSFFLPLWKQKWEKIEKLEGEAEIVVEEVEYVAGVVEKAALAVEKLSDEAAEKLPENHGTLKGTALFVERISEATAQDAQFTLDFIHKVDDLKEDLNDLNTLVEPIVNKIVHKKSEGK